MALKSSYSTAYEDTAPDNTGIASLASDPGAAVTVNAPAAASLPNYEMYYSVFGGQDATNAMLAKIRAMGISEDFIANTLLAPYRPTKPAAPAIPVAPATPVDTTPAAPATPVNTTPAPATPAATDASLIS